MFGYIVHHCPSLLTLMNTIYLAIRSYQPQVIQNGDRQQILVDYRQSAERRLQGPGMQSILQQSIRYNYHYGTEYSLLTDGVCGIVLIIPPTLEASFSTDDTQEDDEIPVVTIKWRFVEKTEIKRVVAYSLWRELRGIRASLLALSSQT